MLPVLFGILEIILAYFIAKELSDSRLCGLLAMFFVAVSAGNIARTAALVYRGDTFIAVPLMLALLIMIKGMKLRSTRKMVVYALVAAFILSTGVLVWNGSPYIVAIYMLSLVLLTALFIHILEARALKDGPDIHCRPLPALSPPERLRRAGRGAGRAALEGNSFLAFYIPILLGAVVVFWLTKRGRIGVLHSPHGQGVGRHYSNSHSGAWRSWCWPSGATSATIATAAGVVRAGERRASNHSNISYAVGVTTQELQKPSFSFLFASFELGLYLLLIGVRDAAPTADGRRGRRGTAREASSSRPSSYLLAALVFLFLLNYAAGFDQLARLRTHSSYTCCYCSWPTGSTAPAPALLEGKWHAFLVLFSYLAVTAYLQYNAIRYNSLLSIPLAIFAAYGLYTMIEIAGRMKLSQPELQVPLRHRRGGGAGGHRARLAAQRRSAPGYASRTTAGTSSRATASVHSHAGHARPTSILPILKGEPIDLKKICLLAAAWSSCSSAPCSRWSSPIHRPRRTA